MLEINFNCSGCGATPGRVAIHRISPKGEAFVGKCSACLGEPRPSATMADRLVDAMTPPAGRECAGRPLAPGAVDDGLHCEHWQDGGQCCRCGAPVEGKDTKPMITDEQVAEEIARLTRERDRAEQLAQHRGELLEKFTGELAAANAELALVREVLSCAKEWWSNRYLDGDALRSDERELGAALDMLAAAKSGGDVPVESAPAAETPSCDEPVWDGPYQMRCGRLMPRGECGRHGKPLGGAASVATTEGVDHG